MYKLSMTLAALAIQTCTVVQADSITVTLPNVTITEPTLTTTAPTLTPGATTSPATSATNSAPAVGGSIDKIDQLGQSTTIYKQQAGGWLSRHASAVETAAVKAGTAAGHAISSAATTVGNTVGSTATAADCLTDGSMLCGENPDFAVQEIKKCHAHPHKASNCFANICTRLNAQPGTPQYNATYNATVTQNQLLQTPWKDKKGNAYTYGQSLGCTPPVGSVAPVAPVAAH